ncbi:MAG: three-Cys-motif partner protein TcmP [Coriobacteriia bacterium]|nr:three-Cys-motif partner protein TcmP [Coriobacteriia bacterium]
MIEQQTFGDFWTEQKLDVVEKYLSAYTTALKNQSFRLCYIDAFSGSGNVLLKNDRVIDGSALRALRYPFDRYFFFEKNRSYHLALLERISADYPDKLKNITTKNGDCNELLDGIENAPWLSRQWRGVIFLDPCAMDLSWASLEKISKTQAFDVWYLFPLSAVTRNLPNDGKVPPAWEANLTRIFGTPDWKQRIYQQPSQMSLFDNDSLEKIPDGLEAFIKSRLEQTFHTVAPNPLVLKNSTNSPMFLLCFAGSNPNEKARQLSPRIAGHILKNMGGE